MIVFNINVEYKWRIHSSSFWQDYRKTRPSFTWTDTNSVCGLKLGLTFIKIHFKPKEDFSFFLAYVDNHRLESSLLMQVTRKRY